MPVKIAAYLVSIGRILCLAIFTDSENIPGLAPYFDNLAVYFKTSWQLRETPLQTG